LTGVLIAIVAIVAIVAGLLWVFTTKADKGASTSDTKRAAPTQQPPPVPRPQPRSEDIVSDEFDVKATQYASYRFVVPEGVTNVRVVGHFSASGGSGNDIEAYILDDDNYANWRNRHPAGSYYNSGRVTQSTMNVPLAPVARTYYLVFNNRFSLFSQKTVNANVELHYLQ
jgi:hypothetical protein